MLLAAICLEGLGRKFVPGLPSVFWYFGKDVVLLVGVGLFGIGRPELATARRLYRGFGIFLVAAAGWTLLQVANPEQKSLALALIGLRAYWFWWVAPLVVASALRAQQDLAFAVRVFAIFAIGIAVLASVQFEFPGDATINRYAWESDDMGIAGVGQTGRVRVTSTFSYLTGFTDFVIVALPLLVALGLGEGRSWDRVFCFAGAALLGATVPMSGSRAAIVLSIAGVGSIIWSAGVLRTRQGRAIAAGALVLGVVGWLSAPNAVEGVQSRFAGGDTSGRFTEALNVFPPVAMATYDYPLLGIGTGMQQNARVPLGVQSEWGAEGEQGRYLIELGAVGYLLVWFARLGLVVALLKAVGLAKRAGRPALAGLGLAFAGLTFIGNLAFDHVWQALLFVGLGFVLQCVAGAAREQAVRLKIPAGRVTSRGRAA